MNQSIEIPKGEQLIAILGGLPAIYALIARYTGHPVREDFRRYLTVTRDQLVAFLRENPAAADETFARLVADRPYHDEPFLEEDDPNYVVGWMDRGAARDVVRYQERAEAMAAVLMYWT